MKESYDRRRMELGGSVYGIELIEGRTKCWANKIFAQSILLLGRNCTFNHQYRQIFGTIGKEQFACNHIFVSMTYDEDIFGLVTDTDSPKFLKVHENWIGIKGLIVKQPTCNEVSKMIFKVVRKIKKITEKIGDILKDILLIGNEDSLNGTVDSQTHFLNFKTV